MICTKFERFKNGGGGSGRQQSVSLFPDFSSVDESSSRECGTKLRNRTDTSNGKQ